VLRLDRALRSWLDPALRLDDERAEEVRCRSERRVRIDRDDREREERSSKNVE
jgi:hypothetical protein